jgi:K+:H+ antiporter
MAFALLAIVCLLAFAGKLGPAYLAARVSGLTGRDSATIAVLLNTRGLTELIALNVGLSVGVIDRQIFSVLVLMALTTTLATAPLLRLIRVPVATARVSAQSTVRSPPPAAGEP